jgi:hypothetical protein
MDLSEHELRIWHELERELRHHTLLTWLRLYWPWLVLLFSVAASVGVLAAFAPASVAAPVAAVCAGFAGVEMGRLCARRGG